MKNADTQPIDVTLLYIDAEKQIQCFKRWGKARIDPHEVRDRVQPFAVATRDARTGQSLPIGRERLIVIGVEKPARDAIETTFCHLEQKSLDSAREQPRSRSSESAFAALVEEAGLAVGITRGFTVVGPSEAKRAVIRTFTWDVRDSGAK